LGRFAADERGVRSLDTLRVSSDDERVIVPIFLLGATGVGKSAVALELARARGAAILALDALQVYRGADIGVSKPGAAEQAEIPHGGIDLVDFGAPFDVARYVEHATAFLAEQERAGRPVIVAGGTGLYFRALTQGLCDAPPTPPALRDELNALSLAELRARLERVDAPMIEKLEMTNPRRLIRAIAVMETTGRSLAAWQAETPAPPVREFRAFWLQRPKWELDRRIAARVEAMFAAGWVEEVRGLLEQYGAEKVEAFPGIGYGEIARAVGASLPPEVVASLQRHICVATRQYAKRQLTWFRREPTLQPVTLSGAATVPPALLSL
jgi:tRNA dimethylallyltransferase